MFAFYSKRHLSPGCPCYKWNAILFLNVFSIMKKLLEKHMIHVKVIEGNVQILLIDRRDD